MTNFINIAKLTKLDSSVFNDAPFHVCVYCSKKISKKKTTRDHITPRSRGGKGAANYATACSDCNQRKANLDLLTFLFLQPSDPRTAQQLRRRPRKRSRKDQFRKTLTHPVIDSRQEQLLRLFQAGATNLVISAKTKEDLSRV